MTEVQTLEGAALTQSENKNPIIAFKDLLTAKKSSLQNMLPRHIPFEKFQSVVMTAVMQNSDLLRADRASLINSCLKSATDGLLPDGRDAALVIFNAKVKDQSGKEQWTQKVQYMPMYMGILKKVRQSEELMAITTQVVYANDHFEHNLGDEDTIIHRVKDGANRGDFKAVYCIAKLKDGTVMKEVMYMADVEKVRRTSKSGNKNGEPAGIWKDWYEEMAKKTVFRRLAKWLPQSIDKGAVVDAFENDESMDIIDQEAGGVATYTEVPEKGSDTVNQPDLKQVINNARDGEDSGSATSNEVKKPEPKALEKVADLLTTPPVTVWILGKDDEPEEMIKSEYDDLPEPLRPKLYTPNT